MKRNLIGLVAAMLALGTTAWGQGTITLTVDEAGNGKLVNSATGTFTLPSSMAADPGPGGLASALTYNLLGPPGLVIGDVVMFEPGSGEISDLLRFNQNGTLVFYSDNSEPDGDLADTGFPTARYTNLVRIPEVGSEGNNGAIYTPTSSQPGFVSGVAFPVSYHFISDAEAVPEPGTLALLSSLGLSALLIVRSRRARQQ